jgi:translation initiation factor 1A
MPKNTGMGGNKRKKGKKQVQEDRELTYKGESEEYAQVIKILGDGRFECNCADGVKRVAHVRGKMRKRIWIANGDIILVSLRDFEPEKCDVVEKYKEKEVAKLKKAGEIPDSMVLPSSSEADEEKEEKNDYGDIIFEEQENDKGKKKDDDIDFGNDDDDEDEKKESDEEKEEKKEKKDEDEDEDKKEDEKEEEEKEKEEVVEKTKKSKREKKEKEKKIKKKRDDKKKGGGDDDKEFNIDDI